MSFPESVTQIVGDYLERVKAQLRVAPEKDREEFLRELRSHIYEAYQQDQEAVDDVAKILRVLRDLGEPSEVVADRLPGAMVRNGAKQSWPWYVLGGLLIALFGIPLGISGVGVLLGVVATAAGLVVAYYATAGAILLASVLFLLLGFIRTYRPELWDGLLAAGVIQMDPQFADVFDRLSASSQASMMIFLAVCLAGAGIGMLWFGKYLIRGLRFLANLILDAVQRMAHRLRRAWRRRDASIAENAAFFESTRTRNQRYV
jgi:hypothetical protein